MSTLLFDNNLSPRLPQLLADTFPGGVHVRAVGLAAADDLAVWSYAHARGHAIVTKDDDFRQLAFLHGAPPKVIWVTLGNCTTGDIVALLRDRKPVITMFLSDQDASLLVLRPDPLAMG